MSSYIDNLIDKLCKNYNFNIIELEGINGICSRWALCREQNSIMQVVFFSKMESYRNINVEDIKLRLKNLFDNKSVRLVQIVLDRGEHATVDKNNNPQCGLIFLNPYLNQITLYTPDLKELAKEIYNCMIYAKQSTLANKQSKNIYKMKDLIVTWIIIALNVAVYAVTAYLSGNVFDSDVNVLVFMGAKVNSLIASGQYYRLFTCMFLHAGIVHLGVNMYSLYIMGSFVEKVYGKVKYIVLYLISGLVSSVFSFMFSSSISVGASGAIFGLLGAALVFAIKMKHKIGKEFLMNVLSIIVVNLIIGFSIANVDNFGHLGGLVGGIVITYLLGNVKNIAQ
ncbi:rhomboid protease GluP [Clostridium ragsdalei P11]|uniref:Rhomboid protease GluP n=1 Tax=Clostridium ragsdalei P11 TaxID=1353534 RepID=A0A1A6B0X7_9CLOT|nr:rhomboid family intramembrane serine protease [Clostridium ragsdalei]OBR95957.1 rhomboid protease GluP [Clostridium ragsdalei P11]